MNLTISRKSHFNAAHKLYRPDWSDKKNEVVFGKCANKNFHGHNYDLTVSLTGKVDSETGYYQFSQGSNVISYLISFTNSDNRMTWVDQTSGDVTMWDRVVTAVATE